MSSRATGACLWIAAAPPPPILSEPQDRMEQALDHAILGRMTDGQMGNRIDIAVRSTTILLGLTATLVTAAITLASARRLKITTVSLAALTATLIDEPSTFHLRENIHTDATAFTAPVVLEADDSDKRDHLAETDAAALRRDTVDTLTRIRSERMLSLASIGAGAPAGWAKGWRRGVWVRVGRCSSLIARRATKAR